MVSGFGFAFIGEIFRGIPTSYCLRTVRASLPDHELANTDPA